MFKKHSLTLLAALFIFTIESPVYAGLLGPLGGSGANGEYAKFDDSPFNDLNFSYFYLEDFEDSLFNTPGVSSNAALISTPNLYADSVDADDGVINGLGQAGHSFWSETTITFTFDPAILGALPTHAGLVFTDGTPNSQFTFTAFDQNNALLGSVSAYLGDFSFAGTTAEDRFFGAVNAGGISKISITDHGTVNDIEVDHLQYGRIAATVPEPASLALLVLGLAGLGFTRRRRRA